MRLRSDAGLALPYARGAVGGRRDGMSSESLCFRAGEMALRLAMLEAELGVIVSMGNNPSSLQDIVGHVRDYIKQAVMLLDEVAEGVTE